jgi:AcrR family transcriptional regulator
VPTSGSHRRGEYVRRTVLAAAWEELAEVGLARATVAGVARRSGVHETTIYRRWVTRENLLVDAMLTHSADVIPTPDTGSTREDLLAVVRAVIAHASSPAGNAVLHAMILAVDDAYDDARKAFWAGRLQALRPVVTRGIERGDLRPDTDARLVLEMLIAPVHGRVLFTGEPIDDELADRLVNLVLDGVGASSANRSRAR